jgi:hypothetical protein
MLCSNPSGTILLRRSAIDLSMMKATARIEASKSGQMGQPAAWMMANTQGPRCFLNNGELYMGGPVSARKTACELSPCNDNFFIHKTCG